MFVRETWKSCPESSRKGLIRLFLLAKFSTLRGPGQLKQFQKVTELDFVFLRQRYLPLVIHPQEALPMLLESVVCLLVLWVGQGPAHAADAGVRNTGQPRQRTITELPLALSAA